MHLNTAGMPSSTSECGVSSLTCQTVPKPKLSSAFRYALPLSSKWSNIGVLLELEDSILEKIEHDYSKADDRLRKVLSEWMKRSPSWRSLAEAVELFDPSVAEKIRQEITPLLA